MDKTRVWSDGHNSRPSDNDMMSALGDREDEKVEASERSDVVELLSNCRHCGRQCKSIVPWAEVCMMFLGQIPQPPPWKPTRQGILMPLGCACGKTSPMIIGWDEVRRWVDVGIRCGSLDPNILNALK